MTRLSPIVLVLLMLGGCTNLQYAHPQGGTLTLQRVGLDTSFQSLNAHRNRDGSMGVAIEGYQSEGSRAIAALAEIAARAAQGQPQRDAPVEQPVDWRPRPAVVEIGQSSE